MRVLVMGGTQFNGLALVRELSRTGHDVTIVNRGKSEAVVPTGVRRLIADRTDADQMRAVLGGEDFDAVVDVSAYLPGDVELMVEIFKGRIAHYVFVSSTVIHATSDLLPITEDHPLDRTPRQNEYGRNKILCEDILFREHRENGFPASVVALSMVFGPNNILPDREQRMFQRFIQDREILIPGAGRTLQQFGHVDDQARALRMVLCQPVTFGQRYTLTGKDYFSQEGYVDVFSEVTGKEARKCFIPADLMEDLWHGRVEVSLPQVQSAADTRGREKPDPVLVNRFMLSMLVQQIAPHLHHWDKSTLFSVEKLQRHVGWEPEYTVRGAVEQTWQWYQGTDRPQTQVFDFAFEDQLIQMVKERN